MTIHQDVKPDWTTIDTQVKHQGKEIVLPSDPGEMEYDAAIETLQRIKEQESQEFDVHERVYGAPWDALQALYHAMQKIYGVVLSESVKTIFGEIKPDFMTIQTGPNDRDKIQVPYGTMSLPGVKDSFFIGTHDSGAFIQGTVKKKDRARLIEIANLAREILKTGSVYRGKAIRLSVDEYGDLNLDNQPQFINLDGISVSDMIHTKETEALIRTNIFSPLENTEACRNHQIPLKRGILLEGRYGTGKSLTARVTAKVAADNGWTFLMLDRSQGLKSAIEFAQHYQPCVIFAEDIDRCADRDDEDVNDLVNMLDGLISKDMEMMVVLTTNFIEKIDRALLRPGRFDAVISIQPPDAETAERLVHAYARDLLDETADLSEVGEVIAGQIPATIREVVERAKLAMLTEGRKFLTEEDLEVSAIGMKHHMALLEPAASEATPAEKLFDAIKLVMSASVSEAGIEDLATEQDLETSTGMIQQHIGRVEDRQRDTHHAARSAAVAAKKAADNTEKLVGMEGGSAIRTVFRPAS